MPRISTKLLANRAKEACLAVGLDFGPHYEKGEDGHYHAIVGRVALTKGMSGYDLEEIVNDGGAIRQVNGWCNAMKAETMLAYLDGMIFAAKRLKSEA